jgi:DNA-binding response OmpR family regulator
LPPIVLLLDDERDILDMYSAHFEAEGVWVATAASAREGMIAVEELRPDLIVTDIGFGSEVSGATFAQALKERTETSGIPLIVLTGLATEDMPSSVKEDADLFLRKPVAPQALLLNIRRLLESSHALRARSERARARVVPLLEKSADLRARAKTTLAQLPGRDARCPQCCEPLSWVERGRIDAREFDYYQWCARGCGLYCFDLAARKWIRLV